VSNECDVPMPSEITQESGKPTELPARRNGKRGFAALELAIVRELARKGGVAAHRAGTAHQFSSEEARAAGRKGGLAARTSRTSP
jgi:general stress protein YciG